MRRPVTDSNDMPGQDSFMDVVANMVGILVILVMIVGARARKSPAEAAATPVEPASMEKVLSPLQDESHSLETDVQRLARESEQLQADLAARTAQREQLATLVAAMEAELEVQRQQLDDTSKVDFDYRRQFAMIRQQLESLQQQKESLSLEPAKQIKVQSLPTPISKTVHGQELHYQLRQGRVTRIPLDELLESFQETAKHKLWKLEDQAQMTDTIGPIGGFRLRYELGRFEISPEVARQTGRSGSRISLVKWELLPVTLDLGETGDVALSPGSEFLRSLQGKDPSRVTVTLWVYPDSFETFRRLKAHLHGVGFASSGRPLPMDVPIGGSPEGSRSAAQ